MKSTILFGAAAVAAFAVMSGCAPEAPASGGTTTATGEKGAMKPIEVIAFKGGFGTDFFEKAGTEWAEKNKTTAKVDGDPKVWEQLKPRFVSEDVPDVTWPGWGMDYWGLVADDQLMDLNAALDTPAYGQTTGKWRDSFDPGLLKMGAYEGKQYMLPYHVNLNGWWYNPKMFKDNGWTVPKTYKELIALNDKIKAKGIAPLTFQGQYPYYMLYGFIFPWTISSGGIEAWNDCQNLVPGAWKAPAVLEAAKRVAELRDRGDFMKGSLALNHTDSQMEFLKGKAAMIPCGTWLHSEMENVMPKDASMEFMGIPQLDGGKGDPTALQVAIEPWVVPAKAKNAAGGIDYYKYITSPEKAKEFIETKGTLMAVKGVEDAKFPDYLVAAAKLFDASKTKWSAEVKLWYPELLKEAENALAALIDGKITPEQFCDRCEAAAEKVRKNPDIVKHKVE